MNILLAMYSVHSIMLQESCAIAKMTAPCALYRVGQIK